MLLPVETLPSVEEKVLEEHVLRLLRNDMQLV
jgi:hypothetical protein